MSHAPLPVEIVSHANNMAPMFQTTGANSDLSYAPADLQLYRTEIPSFDNMPAEFWLQQPTVPDTYAHNEISFARRLQRAGLERGWRLINAKHPPKTRFQEVFGFCLLYETRAQIAARLKRCMTATARKPMNEWRAPLLHVGGAGT